MTETCHVCGAPVDERERLVLVRGRREQVHCSEACLGATIRRRRAARARRRRRGLGGAALVALLLAGASWGWQRLRVPRARTISLAWPEGLAEAPAPGPVLIGPPWPPTDDQWLALFGGAAWTHPLPGPLRREPKPDERVFGPARAAACRTPDHCAVDLGGELWGEHVYAAIDGVVDRVQGDGPGNGQGNSKDEGGGRYVRLVHFGGTVFTQYFHLAGTPRGLVRGAVVKAGDVIGLVGDTGLAGERRHLAFALSTRPSKDLAEVYWDPTPWLARAALRAPPHGTVAGYVPPGSVAPPRP